jgi:hypothetical protein
METKVAFPFVKRGLSGLLLIATGIALSFFFRNSSLWSADVKRIVYPVALVLAMGGTNVLASYVQQRPFSAMRTELLSSAAMLATLLLLGLIG